MRLLPQADTANHLLAAEPADKTFVLGFRSKYLGAQIPNEYIADYCSEHADGMIGFAGIDPTEEDAVDQVTHATRELHLKGLCICPAAQDFHPSDTRAMAVYEQRRGTASADRFLSGDAPFSENENGIRPAASSR